MKSVFIITEIKIYQGNSAGSARMMNFSKALALEGVKVYLCSAILKHNINIDKLQEVYPNIFLVGEESKKQPGRIKRKLCNLINILIIIKYLQKIVKLSKQIRGEVIFYIYPQPAISIDLVGLIYVKFIHHYKLFYDVNELRRASLYKCIFSRNILIRSYQIFMYYFNYIKYVIEEKLTKYYDGLVVISKNIEKYFKKYNNNTLRVPILSDTLKYSFNPRIDYRKGESFRIGFTGSISLRKEGFDGFYKALSLVKSKIKNFELHLYGPISKNEAQILSNDLPLKYGIKKNIIYHGIVEQSILIRKLRENHLLILPRPLNLQTKYGFSTKLSEYLISGIPVLVTDVSDNSMYIRDGYNGFIVEPGDYKKMAEKIIYIISNYKSIKDTVGKNAYLTAKECFNYVNYSKKIYNFIFEREVK